MRSQGRTAPFSEQRRRIAIKAVEGVSTRLPDKEVEFFYEEFGETLSEALEEVGVSPRERAGR